MYPIVLQIHNILRWLILLTGLISMIMAYRGWFGKKKWTNTDNILGITLASLSDLQLLIGLVLYGLLSPITKAAFADFGSAMKNDDLRFYAVEHILVMVIALVIIHLGRIKAKKASDDIRKHRTSAIYYTIALVLIIASIPWSRVLFF